MAVVNRAVRIHGKEDLRIEDVPVPEPEKNHVQLRMSTVGLCRTDVHLYEEGRVDQLVIDKPMTIGHEISGTVSKLGEGVTDLAVGDRVAIDPCRPCGHCRTCGKKRPNLCENLTLSGVIHCDGGFASYMTTPAATCYKLPENVTLEEGALMEPLSVCVNAVHKVGIDKGDSVIVIGAGSIGLLALQCAKAFGAGRVMVSDISESRQPLAKKLGADLFFQSKPDTPSMALAQEMQKELGGGADVCIECSGAKGTVDLAMLCCRPGGKVAVVGIGEMAMHTHLGMAAVREIDIIGVFASRNNYPECIDIVGKGKVDVNSIISHRLPLTDVKKGMDLIKKGGCTKVIIRCDE